VKLRARRVIGPTLLIAAAGALVQFHRISRFIADKSMPWRHGIRRQSAISIPMRDGVKLSAGLYLPKEHARPLPTILIRTTYGGMDFPQIRLFAQSGYAVLMETVRGRYSSEGEYRSPYYRTREDGYDTIEWIVHQPWSNGRVGTFGCSYLGESQVMLAAARHPNHLAMVASGAGGAIGKAKKSYAYFGVFENGVLNLASALGWFTTEGRTDRRVPEVASDYAQRVRKHLGDIPVGRLGRLLGDYPTGFDEFTRHPLTDTWWEEQGYIGPNDRFSAATLHVNSWYDQTVLGSFQLAELMAENSDSDAASAQHLLIDPGQHCSMGKLTAGRAKLGEMEIDYHPVDFNRIYLDWFDHWLKGLPIALPPRYRFFLIHANEWRDSDTWPPKSSQERAFFLAPNRLQPAPNEGSHVQDYDYDPNNPVPTRGGSICCTYTSDEFPGAVDQTPLLERPDVLHYASDVLDQPLDVVGSPRAELHVATNAPDTDFTLKLMDIFPDGKMFNIQDAVVRLRYRNGIAHPELASPGEIYPVTFTLRPVAYRLQKGHRLGMQVSSSNFPRLARNLNTGEHEYLGTNIRIAHNQIFTGTRQQSVLWLPVSQVQ
jgi:uncharacterized protein